MMKAVLIFVAGTVLATVVVFALLVWSTESPEPNAPLTPALSPREREESGSAPAEVGIATAPQQQRDGVERQNVTEHEPVTGPAPGPRARRVDVPPADAAFRDTVQRFRNVTEENFDEKIAELDLLGDQAKAGNDDALQALMALANANVCMVTDVIKRLGATGKPEAGELLLRLARKPDERVSAAAVRELPNTLDDKTALTELDMLLTETEVLPHKEAMRAACVEALGELGAETCIPIAARELGHLDPATDLEYGSQLVALVKGIGDPRAAIMLEKYASRLVKKRPKEKLRAKYWNGKINEALRAAEQLQSPPEPPAP